MSNLFYSMASPVIQYILIKDVGSKIIAFNSIIICIAGIVTPTIWNKYSEKLYKDYGYFLIAEVIGYTTIMILILTGIIGNRAYYLLDTLLFASITKNILCGNNRLRALRYKEKREQFDNNIIIACNASSLVGFTISLIITIPQNIAFIFITIGICLDNFFYFNVYKKSKSQYNSNI